VTPAGKNKNVGWHGDLPRYTLKSATQFNLKSKESTMMHDPFQNTILGSYYGTPAPTGLQYPSLSGPGAINPAAALNPLLGLAPMAQTGGIQQVNPQQVQQLQLASLLASQAIAQNPLLASLLSNPLIAASLHAQAGSPYGAPPFGLQSPSFYPQTGPMGSPFSQVGYPLPPQSWIGQAGQFGGGQGFGQGYPFQSQLSPRPFQPQGFSPWGY
jgi:hypothetical protein